jgi:hypothetical protein
VDFIDSRQNSPRSRIHNIKEKERLTLDSLSEDNFVANFPFRGPFDEKFSGVASIVVFSIKLEDTVDTFSDVG